MENFQTPGSTEKLRTSLKGVGKKLGLHVIIPITYAAILITMFIIKHA